MSQSIGLETFAKIKTKTLFFVFQAFQNLTVLKLNFTSKLWLVQTCAVARIWQHCRG